VRKNTVPSRGNRTIFTEFSDIGDRFEVTTDTVPFTRLGVFATVVSDTHIRVDGHHRDETATGAARRINNIRRVNLGEPTKQTTDGPKYLVNTDGDTVHDLMRLDTLKNSRVLTDQVVSEDIVFCPPGTHTFGGGLIPVKR
tara:strand:+ start:112 stop:534 length:423 start_codon:yes stop_codon:yes gene_type:complete